MTDYFYLTLFLIVCVLVLILSVVMSIKSIHRKGGMLDINSEKLLHWAPFDFMEKYFKIDRFAYISVRQIFKYGVPQDYFYINISKKMNLKEADDYISVRAKMDSYEKKWLLNAIIIPIGLMVCILSLPLPDNIGGYLLIPSTLISVLFTSYKLTATPYVDEFLPLQKKILLHIYNAIFDDNLFDSIELEVTIRRINKQTVFSNYYDLEKVINQMNAKITE